MCGIAVVQCKCVFNFLTDYQNFFFQNVILKLPATTTKRKGNSITTGSYKLMTSNENNYELNS